MTFPHFPNDAKPISTVAEDRVKDRFRRPFHRINAPHYDTGVDLNQARRGIKLTPSGLARLSGARGPDAFQASGFLDHFAKLAAKLAKAGLLAIPIVGEGIAIFDEAIKLLTGTSPIEELFKALAKLAGAAVESALFARFLRSIPAWVPVGREGYKQRFTYEEDGTRRTTTDEEEREVEGFLSASYLLANDLVYSQWTKFRHWAFHVNPVPGFRYLVGDGNVRDPNEEAFLSENSAAAGDVKFTPVLRIYGQHQRSDTDPLDRGAIECLLDVGAISQPVGDRGSHGVHFSEAWPYWPMAGDYFWAAGRWSYDCMRATPQGKTELYPTQINPIKAFASARLEGFKFQENPKPVPAVRFFFFASSEGGFRDFRTVPGRKGPPVPSSIRLRDQNYEFIVDLPPHERGRDPYPVGSTILFARNTLVLRPRLLIQVRQVPFDRFEKTPKFAQGITPRTIEPKVEILRPLNPNERPSQAKVTIPLKELPAAPADAREMVGLDIALGWHDATGEEERSLIQVKAEVRLPRFFRRSGNVRMVVAINGRWGIMTEAVTSERDEPLQDPPPPNTRSIHAAMLLLPPDAVVSVATSGIRFHGFGEFIEQQTLDQRRLEVGGLLLNVSDENKRRLKALLNDARKAVNDLREAGDTVRDPKGKLKEQLKQRIEEERRKGTDPRALAELEKQLNALVNGLPDTPEGVKQSLAALDKRLEGLLGFFDAIDEFLKVTDDLIGERHFPHWHEDIDNEQKTGVEESKRVSAIARTMFIHPTPVVNAHDDPLGWVEFTDETRGTLGRPTVKKLVVPDVTQGHTARGLLDQARDKPGQELVIRMMAHPMTFVGSGNNLAQRINPPRENAEYEFALVLTVHAFPFPLRTSDDPPLL